MTTPVNMVTAFAPIERSPAEELERQAQHLLSVSPFLRAILDAVPDVLMVLNANRQIVLANGAALTKLETVEDFVRSMRPGEALGCIHADGNLGCGTTEFCRTCGAFRAILESRSGRPAVQECRITRRGTGESLDLRVHATPFCVGTDSFTIFVLTDISDEKRRRALEHIFFHDILNTATAMRAAADLLRRSGPEITSELAEVTRNLVDRLIEEIASQRQLTDAENNELIVNPVFVDVAELLQQLASTWSRHDVAAGRDVCVKPLAVTPLLVSDLILLRRVIGNMLKNALEASQPGEMVTLGCDPTGDGVEFWVHNPGTMPREVALQVFQRSFSTKGSGRGLGTYSMRLLSERYLGGRVSFTTSLEKGTTFRAWYPERLIH